MNMYNYAFAKGANVIPEAQLSDGGLLWNLVLRPWRDISCMWRHSRPFWCEIEHRTGWRLPEEHRAVPRFGQRCLYLCVPCFSRLFSSGCEMVGTHKRTRLNLPPALILCTARTSLRDTGYASWRQVRFPQPDDGSPSCHFTYIRNQLPRAVSLCSAVTTVLTGFLFSSNRPRLHLEEVVSIVCHPSHVFLAERSAPPQQRFW